jgi:RNA polymerase sigma-70 factor (ECF subfamily)
MVSPSEVEDATQEMSLRVMRGLRRFRGDSSLGTWIFSVARHTCLDVRRRRRPPATVLPDDLLPDALETGVPFHSFEMSILACRTALALQQLPPTQRDVVLLRLGAGASTAETARELGITPDAVKARLRRARIGLRKALEETIECPKCGPGAYRIEGGGVQ